jgi:glutaconyl-CoA/methylmalonyl-CoA decarboxylase subunit gamma
MKKSIKVQVNGKLYSVEIEDLGGASMHVVVDGTAYQVSVEDETLQTPTAVSTPAPIPNSITAPAPRPADKPAAVVSGNVLSAPMPGVIMDIKVKPGDRVSHGQHLCALEAMKMKNAIRSPREGVVQSVEVQEKQKVAHGDVLFRFE